MKKSILLIALALGVVSVKAQKLDASAVPSGVTASFQKSYSAIKEVKWEKEGGNYEAHFKDGAGSETAVYDATGKFLQSEKAIAVTKLPKDATDYLSKNLPGKKVKEAAEIKDAAGVITYEAEVNEVDYTFDAKGKFLKQEADED